MLWVKRVGINEFVQLIVDVTVSGLAEGDGVFSTRAEAIKGITIL